MPPLTEHPTPAPASFRPIHYLGGKSRLLDTIERTLDEVAGTNAGPVCDLFSGSGVVAARLARRRPVVAVDIQAYARVLAVALSCPDVPSPATFLARAREHAAEVPTAPWVEREQRALAAAERGDAERLCEILETGSLERLGTPPFPRSRASVLSRYYGGVFFSYAQAAALDGLAEAARALPAAQRDTALAAVFAVAGEVVSSVGGHFAQPVRPRGRDGQPKPAAIRAVLRRRSLDAFALAERALARYAALPGTPEPVHTVCADYRDALATLRAPAAVYADPPYTRDHYSRFYHVLETIARGDEPDVTRVGTVASRGLYRVQRHQSPFCIKRAAPGAFAQLFEGVRRLGCPLVVSYSPYVEGGHPRLLTVEQVEALAQESFDHVEVRSAGRLAHSKLNASRLRLEAAAEAEIILVCR